MDDEVQKLVLEPFQDLIEKGNTALENATDANATEMLKAAQSLVKMGGLALKKIEPLCKKYWEDYSTNFVIALKENSEIAEYRPELNDLLWDFEAMSLDEVENFDASEYSKLRTVSSRAAKKIYEILMRMKLEPPAVVFDGFDSAGVSRTTSVAGRSTVSDTGVPPTDTPDTIEEESPDTEPPQSVRGITSNPTTPMGAQAGPDLGYDEPVRERTSSRQDVDTPQQQRSPQAPESPVIPPLYAATVRPEDIPLEPLVNPWDPKNQAVVTVRAVPGDLSHPPDRRRRVSSEDSARSYTPPFIVSNAFGELHGAQPRRRRLDDGVVALMQEEIRRDAVFAEGSSAESRSEHLSNDNHGTSPLPSQRRALPLSPTSSAAMRGDISPSQRQPRAHTPPYSASTIIPDDTRETISHANGAVISSAVRPTQRVLSSHRHSQDSSTSRQSSLFDPNARDIMISPVTDHRESVHEDYHLSLPRTDSYATVPEENLAVRPAPASPSAQTDMHSLLTVQLRDQPGLEPAPILEEQAGLEPVGDGSAPTKIGYPSVPPREPNCTITVDSSFDRLRGFCGGAKDIIRGGVGVKKVRKGGIGAASALIAKCTNKSCMFELEWDAVEADVNKSETANYRNSGIGFRLRFISKSHLAARNIDDHMYGCLFCIQLGRTSEESDATVFPNQKALFSHLARHPRPLPPVPGLTVVDSAEIPPQFRHNYDLHFPNPPVRSVMPALAREVSAMPAAVATDTYRRTQLSAMRAPPDPSVPTLQFFAGQRIVGIEFRYNGEWALGWADNTRGAFPVDCVKIEAPPERELRKTAGSGLRAVARWKRHPKEKEVKEGGWLKLEKGEVITNISFPNPEHWCWYGTNSRGRHGIFPQSYMEPNTLAETPGGDRASLISHESRSASSRMPAMFSSIRRRETRPLSSAESQSSGDTAVQHSTRPSR